MKVHVVEVYVLDQMMIHAYFVDVEVSEEELVDHQNLNLNIHMLQLLLFHLDVEDLDQMYVFVVEDLVEKELMAVVLVLEDQMYVFVVVFHHHHYLQHQLIYKNHTQHIFFCNSPISPQSIDVLLIHPYVLYLFSVLLNRYILLFFY